MKTRPIIAGNWKLNNGPSATREFFSSFLPALPSAYSGTIAIFPPSVSLAAARTAIQNRPEIRLGVQDIYWEDSGAFTGEISATLAVDAGATFALAGHSERRHLFGETDEESARKAHASVASGLTTIFCVGETLAERESGNARAVVERQLNAVLRPSAPRQDRLLVAYEPVWAIGTGRTASPEDASNMHTEVRTVLESVYGSEAQSIPILYGGSVKPENAGSLLSAAGVNGLLVGGASLDPNTFARICSLLT